MADIADDANDLADFFLGQALRSQKQRAIKETHGTGACLSCGSPVDAGRRWCDAGCRDDWERDRATRTR
jgi:RNA polymerase-binding transcription factor DksA